MVLWQRLRTHASHLVPLCSRLATTRSSSSIHRIINGNTGLHYYYNSRSRNGMSADQLVGIFQQMHSAAGTQSVVPPSEDVQRSAPLPEPGTWPRLFHQLNFDNTFARQLPGDGIEANYTRQVRGVCYSNAVPTPSTNPRLVHANAGAAALLDLNPSELATPEFVDVVSGCALHSTAKPIALTYAGHQFGSFAGQLGDGRAISLGEVVNHHGERWEMQLKGAGMTPYSRFADGRAVLRSSIREYMCSEAMNALGVPTSRALSLVVTDEKVVRETVEPGAIVCRLAQSWIRFGSFEHQFYFKQPKVLKRLVDYTITHHFPSYLETAMPGASDEDRYLAFYREVARRTAHTIALWQAVGFVGGVLNTDNFSILGLSIGTVVGRVRPVAPTNKHSVPKTMPFWATPPLAHCAWLADSFLTDYGPFAFMEAFDDDAVFNHTDSEGMYAYGRQPDVGHWNLSRLAIALSPVLEVERAREVLLEYPSMFHKAYVAKMRSKLGLLAALPDKDESDAALVKELLDAMQSQPGTTSGADWTIFFRTLSEAAPSLSATDEASQQQIEADSNLKLATTRARKALECMFQDEKVSSKWSAWRQKYTARLAEDSTAVREHSKLGGGLLLPGLSSSLDASSTALAIGLARRDVMKQHNPKYILRTWMAQKAIDAATANDFTVVDQLFKLLQRPYDDQPEFDDVYARQDTATGPVCLSCSS
ncbi:hypothetical protein, variant 1 [Capsaspora owczarzaki ATCC 30864]|uniref:Selenoprotein O n=1 Tax=Capsaspora owczarzaki (strain ATCC 30864) TaxID=595528 RepID=A0A0D2WSZ1_CAPO3|nr:hypothetical protein, variant 1 [Capsaspora owczarzaki ATCC 30864]